jgi:hypothetical protein
LNRLAASLRIHQDSRKRGRMGFRISLAQVPPPGTGKPGDTFAPAGSSREEHCEKGGGFGFVQQRRTFRIDFQRKPGICGVLMAVCILLSGCTLPSGNAEPSIEFTKLPPAGEGSPGELASIAGRVKGALPGQRVVVFARSGVWWIQPRDDQSFTPVQRDATWKSTTHPGSAYAALLVDPGFHPPLTMTTLPEKGGVIAAVAIADGPVLVNVPVKTLHFSGYEWNIRQVASDAGGSRNFYEPENSWTDQAGFLHLRIARARDHWTSAEVRLTRNLGYGSYRFVVRDVSHLEPAAVFTISTWDDTGPPHEMDIEFSRWGEQSSKNAQYVIQPYYLPANSVRFTVPRGTLTHWLRWEPGRAYFQTIRGAAGSMLSHPVGGHVFTSGVPLPGKAQIHMNLYVFENKANPLREPAEVVVEKFEYLP